MAQTPVGAIYVAGPHRGSDALLPKEGGSSEQKHSLLIGSCSPVFLDSQRVHQRKDVGILRSIANVKVLVLEDGVSQMRPVFLRFSAIKPEGIPSLRK